MSLATLRKIFINSRWVSLGLLALTVYALAIIAQEKRFYLTHIPVEGAQSVTPEQIADASGLVGIHIFASDPNKAAQQIAELPGVISSTVTLRWPNEVLIQINEESPVAVWFENDVEYGITSSGRLIPAGFPSTGLLKIIPEKGKIQAIAPTPVPEEGETGEAVPPPTDAAEEAEAVDAAVEEEVTAEPEPEVTPTIGTENGNDRTGNDLSALPVSIAFVPPEVLAGALQLRELRPDIAELYYRPYGGLSYEDGRGWRGYFGSGTDMNQKLVVYETIVADLLTRGIQPAHISVSNQEKPYYMAQ